ncbi:hypothetical protein ASPWEDRAFT_171055 [Aspergillus wentii DTO 134E9]|uniref:Uncharacterized protein n=1 Tax=Aspergillus wentii DTO 134E9 TaxID=1073089 RepID=A0A1L9RRX9_ASPWE|nr:uncharacterized protein ASPWEDRAFT_171055 [Aspergillus wentii DTO 134E9]KAI9930427.1 hypothetical protein MW887_011181 [Aspergillus wentii]OJJ37587.1 hypothetical protein ASPWEDRAFT_171055 [Aspergillus wentii DTO 134E9]
MNPTVEEAPDEVRAGPNTRGSSAENPQFSWPEICSRHESVLSSHLEMLNSVKDQVLSDADAFRTVSLMVEKTNKLVTQFKVIKKQFVNRPNVFGAMLDQPSLSKAQSGHLSSNSTQPSDAQATSAPHSTRLKEGKKRSRKSQESMEIDTNGPIYAHTEGVRKHKRKRLDLAIPGNDEDVRNVTPVSMETEDISEEVQRRLKIKEDRRKKRNAKPEKRKRDSLASNGSVSSPGERTRPKKKKPKVDKPQEGSDNEKLQGIIRPKRRVSGQSGPNSTSEAKTKRQKPTA